MRIKVPRIKPHVPKPPTGRHSAPGRATRKPAEPKRYTGTRRTSEAPVRPVGPSGHHDAPWMENEAQRRAQGRGRARTVPRPGRPGSFQAKPGIQEPRARFRDDDGSSRARARADYELRQRDELRARKAAAGGGDRSTHATPSRGRKAATATMGRPTQPARKAITERADRTGVRHGRHVGPRPITEPSPSKRISKDAGRAARPANRLRDPHAMPADPQPRQGGQAGLAARYFADRPRREAARQIERVRAV